MNNKQKKITSHDNFNNSILIFKLVALQSIITNFNIIKNLHSEDSNNSFFIFFYQYFIYEVLNDLKINNLPNKFFLKDNKVTLEKDNHDKNLWLIYNKCIDYINEHKKDYNLILKK